MNLSASRMSRAMHCPPSVLLPQTEVQEESSERGTVVHKFMEDYANGGGTESARASALENVPEEYYAICDRLDLSQVPADWQHAKSEVRFLYYPDSDSAQELDRDSDDLPKDCIPAKADLIVEDPAENGCVIIDYKSGRGKIEPAYENWQMRTLAVAADRARKEKHFQWIHVILLYLDCETGETHPSFARFDQFQIHAFAAMIWEFVTETLPAIDVTDPAMYSLGYWCRFCPALRNCPQQMALISELCLATPAGVSIEESIRRVGIEASRLAAAWRRLEGIEAMVKVAKQGFFALASQSPIDLGGGEVLGAHEVPGKRKIEGRAALDWMRQYDPDVEKIVQVDVSQKAMRDALRKAHKPQAPTLRAMLSALEHQGKVKRKNSFRIEVYRPAMPLPPADDDLE